MKRHLLLFVVLSLLCCTYSVAQDTAPIKIATDRLLWHDNIDKQQKRLLSEDGSVNLSPDISVNQTVTGALIKRVDEVQKEIETDSTITTNTKKKYLRSLETMLKGFNANWNKPDFSPTIAPSLVTTFEQCMNRDLKNESIKPVLDKAEYSV